MYSIIISLIIAIFPVYIICLYVYNKDKEKESKKLLTKLILFGIFSCIPAAIIEIIIAQFFNKPEYMNSIELLVYSIIGIGLVEESCKFFLIYKITYHHKEFDHIYDVIVYCVFLSLGFALLENILYVLLSESNISVGILRAICAIPGHACFAIIMGNYLGKAKINSINNNKRDEKKNLILSIIIPSIIHGIYDYCLLNDYLIYFLIFIIVLISIYIYGIKKIAKLSSINENLINSNTYNYCPICGKEAKGKYCTNCGKDLTINNTLT